MRQHPVDEMLAAKARKWREDILEEGKIIGMNMSDAEAQKWLKDEEERGRTLERNDIAYEMPKAGKPRDEIIQFARITETELDKML